MSTPALEHADENGYEYQPQLIKSINKKKKKENVENKNFVLSNLLKSEKDSIRGLPSTKTTDEGLIIDNIKI